MPGILLLVGLAAAYWKQILVISTIIFAVSAIVARGKMLKRFSQKNKNKYAHRWLRARR